MFKQTFQNIKFSSFSMPKLYKNCVCVCVCNVYIVCTPQEEDKQMLKELGVCQVRHRRDKSEKKA